MRKAVLNLAVLAALLAVPSVASATELYSGPTKVPAGTELVGRAQGGVQFNPGSGLELSCSGSEWRGVVEENGPKFVRTKVTSFTFSGTAAEGRCQTAFGATKISIDTPSCFLGATSAWTLEGQSPCLSVSQRAGLTLVSSFTGRCHYTGPQSFSVEGATSLTLRSAGSYAWTLNEGGSGCPHPLYLTARYSVTTAAGAAVRVQ